MNPTTNATTTDTETEVARVRITPEPRHIKALIDMVSDINEAHGIAGTDTEHLDRMLIEVLDNVVRYGFEGDTTKPIEVILSHRLHSMVVAIEEQGLPFDYERLERGEEKRFRTYLSKHYADQVHFLSLGKGGNRTEIVKSLPISDIREHMDIAEHQAHLKAPAADPDEKIDIAMLDPSRTHDLVRLVFKCYGYTYANDFMYSPERIEALLKAGLMLSAVATNSKNELIGHVGLVFSRAGARVAESGEAVVDPRYRGRGIFQSIKNHLLDYVGHHNVAGTYGECVTVHPYSQKGSLDLGGRETGFLLGYSPGTVKFESISENERPRRQSIAMMFTPLNTGDEETVHVAPAYADLVASIYNRLGFTRHLVTEDEGSAARLRYAGTTAVSIRHDHNQAQIRIERVGRKTLEEIRFQLKHLTLERVDCIYVDLPIKQRGAGAITAELRKLGFFFGCLIPEYADGDMLRLQYLNNVEVAKDDIKTASDFGQQLLDATFEDMAAVDQWTHAA